MDALLMDSMAKNTNQFTKGKSVIKEETPALLTMRSQNQGIIARPHATPTKTFNTAHL